MDNRIEKIYEAEKAAVQKRDGLAQRQKAKREEVKKAFAVEREAALSEAEAEVSRRLAEAKEAAEKSMEKAKAEASEKAAAEMREAEIRLALASDFIVREIFEA